MVKRVGIGVAMVAASLLTTNAWAERTPKWGGFGHAFAGVLAGSFGGIENDLSAPEALGRYSLSPAGLRVGGGGWALLGGGFMLGGRGFGLILPSEEGERGGTSLGGGGGGFDLGWAIYNKKRFMVYPFIGIGGYGYTVEIRNSRPALATGGGDIKVGSLTIPAGGAATIEGGVVYSEIGIGAQRFLFRGYGGGFMVGGELGALFSLSSSNWMDANGADIAGLSKPSINGGYVMLTFGGGGFFYSKPRRRW